MHRWFSNLSLNAKLVALCASLVLALSGVLLVELPRAMEVQSRGWIASRSLDLGRLLASSVEASFDFDDPAAAAGALAGIRSSRGAVYAIVLRADGTVYAEWREPRFQGRAEAPPGRGETAEVVDGILRVRVPIETRSGRSATLLLGFGLEELEERRREARGSVLWTSALVLACGLGVALVIGKVLARPIHRMTEVAQRVAAGHTDEARNLPVDRRDEVGVLGAAFRQMLERLYAQQEQIRVINADLAERVQERTRELARTNEALAQLEQTQEQLVMADRRISVGRLAAGVAHEINNPMSFLSSNLDFVAAELPRLRARWPEADATTAPEKAFEELSRAVADCRQGVERVVRIVRGLKTFARDDEDERELISLEGPLDAAIAMSVHAIKHRARLVREVAAAPPVLASEVRLSQVFLNLLINAAQAIQDGAPIREIRARLGAAPDGRAQVEISDTGCGMTPEVMNRIFDPFFTTKPVGVGSGLGLAISRNIVANLGGEIVVESEPGRGSSFRVLLPPAQPAQHAVDAVRASALPPEAAPASRGIRLLVVDDEPLIGQAVGRALADGFHVRQVTSAREALALIEQGERFDRVLCDVMMPEMNGPELFVEVARVAPDWTKRFVFMTGGAFTDGASTFVEKWTGPMLQKPIDQTELRRILHDGVR